MRNIVGIDFGSSFCRTAVVREGGAETVANRYSERALPLAVEAFPDAAAGPAPPLTFCSLKERLGSEAPIALEDRKAVSAEAASAVFRELLEDAGENLGQPIQGAVVGHPPCFLERQRAALREAAERGGFPRVLLLDEAVASLLHSEFRKEDQTVLVYALGAGSFWTSVVRIVRGSVEELCHEGSPALGGNLFDAVLMGVFLDRVGLSPAHLRDARESVRKLKALAERCKRDVCKRPWVDFDLPLRELFTDQASAGRLSLRMRLLQEEFESQVSGHVAETVRLARKAIQDRKLEPGEIGTVVLLGGSTNIPLVEQRLRQEFPASRIARLPEDAVARALALYGAQLPDAEWNPARPPAPAAREPAPEPESAAPPLLEPGRGRRAARSEEAGWVGIFAPGLSEAQAAWNRGDQLGAIERVERVLHEDGRRFLAQLHVQRAKGFLEAGQLQAAASLLERAQQYDSRDESTQRAIGLYHRLRGRSLVEAGEFDSAIRAFRLALGCDSRAEARRECHQAWSGKARQLFHLGRLAEARMALRESLQIDSGCPRCRQLLQEIEAARGAGGRSPSDSPKRKRR
ncbi:MAG: Hsp70 family protein [Bryobacteraceae bacterium]|jgi:hypothetical protein